MITQVWKCTDGKLFDYKAQAEKHEQLLKALENVKDMMTEFLEDEEEPIWDEMGLVERFCAWYGDQDAVSGFCVSTYYNASEDDS